MKRGALWTVLVVLAGLAARDEIVEPGQSEPPTLTVVDDSAEHDRGFNTALEAIALRDVENCLNGKRETWGEMADALRMQYGVGGKCLIGASAIRGAGQTTRIQVYDGGLIK